MPAVATNGNRALSTVSPVAGFRTPPAHNRSVEVTTHQSNHTPLNDRQFVCVLNDKSLRPTNIYDAKYDNCSKVRPGDDTLVLVLKRDKRVLDFGFSISDRLYGTGVYVNKIRPSGPAELEGTLIPCMRIYKVRPQRERSRCTARSSPGEQC